MPLNNIILRQLAIVIIAATIGGIMLIKGRYTLTPFQTAVLMFLGLTLGLGSAISVIIVGTTGHYKQLVVVVAVVLPIAIVGGLGSWLAGEWVERRFRR